jgi:hypothetical protein
MIPLFLATREAGGVWTSGRVACVNGPRNLPSFGLAKFPTLAGMVISRWGDRHLHFWVDGRAAWAAA